MVLDGGVVGMDFLDILFDGTTATPITQTANVSKRNHFVNYPQ